MLELCLSVTIDLQPSSNPCMYVPWVLIKDHGHFHCMTVPGLVNSTSNNEDENVLVSSAGPDENNRGSI